MKIFLGGTCNESTWRDKLISKIKCDYFNPVVDDWTPDCILEEEKQKLICDYCVFVITPKMTGVYSIAEMVDYSNKYPKKTLCCILTEDGQRHFDLGQIRSFYAVCKILIKNGVKKVSWNLEKLAKTINYLTLKA